MIGGESKHIITVEKETGKVVKVVDENGNKTTELTPDELELIYQRPDGFKYVALILHAHSSPG